MKKFFLFLLVGVLICGVVSANADDSRRRIRTTVVTADDPDVTVANVAGEYFDEDRDVLLGFTVFGDGCIVGIYDITTLGATAATNVVAEAETTNAARNTETVWFKYPKSFTNGITVVFNDTELSPNYGVILYWERDREQYN